MKVKEDIYKGVKDQLRNDYKLLKSYAKVAKKYKVSTGTLHRIINGDGYTPKDIIIRRKLGLYPEGPPQTIFCPCCNTKIQYEISREVCPYCHRYYIIFGEHRDHIIPRGVGGPDAIWNYIECCKECNLTKSNRDPWEWLGEDWKPEEQFQAQFAYAKQHRIKPYLK